MRRLFTLVPATVGLSGLFALFVVGPTACINPRDGYDDYIARTNDVRGVSSHDAGSFESSVPVGNFESFEGAYAMQCFARLALTVNKTLRFKTHMTFTADADKNGGKLVAAALTPLRCPEIVRPSCTGTGDYSEVVPPILGDFTATVRADGHFDLDIGKVHLPGDANAISSNDIQFDFAIIRGLLQGTKKFCGGLDGFVSQPSQIPLNATDDICLFEQVPSDTTAGPGTLPVYVKEDFHCP